VNLRGRHLMERGVAMTREEKNEQEIQAIANEAYVYLYPLVLSEVARRVMINGEPKPNSTDGPMNMFHHLRAFPPADFKEVLRPNFDALYSSVWLDLNEEPMILSVPDTQDRYYVLEMVDMWGDTFAVPGKRTSGTSAMDFAVVPQGWQGKLPKDVVERIDAPTTYVCIVGRTYTNGSKDYDAVHKIQDGYRITLLSQWGKAPKPLKFQPDPMVDLKTAPSRQVEAMRPADFFEYAADLMKLHPPHITDWSMTARLKQIGIVPGESFEFKEADPAVQRALEQAPAKSLQWMKNTVTKIGRIVNGWQMNTEGIGVWGNAYLKRAACSWLGAPGWNQPEDATYPMTFKDADGKPYSGSTEYVIHFGKQELPPVNAFWSITLYDADGFAVPNPLNRYAIGDRNSLKYNADGSLDLYVQKNSPGKDKEANWLPASEGEFGLIMRLYAPKPEVLDGRWAPPAVRRAAAAAKAA
jgi:hypothetical protein